MSIGHAGNGTRTISVADEMKEKKAKPTVRELVTFVIHANDKHGKFASEFHDVYGDEYTFNEVEFTNSLHKAIQSLDEKPYDLCVISDSFPDEELATFFSDYVKVNQTGGCIFVYALDLIPDDFDSDKYLKMGFHGVISLQGNFIDRSILKDALKEWHYEEEINRRSYDVDSALNLVLSELDRLARDKKRGIDKQFNQIPSEFINLQTEFDEQILHRYYAKLMRKANNAEPENAKGVKIPEVVLRKELPNLTENVYSGASQRVWKKLLRLHGVKNPDQGAEATKETPPQIPTEELPVENPAETPSAATTESPDSE